jgi:hypothetical protein
VLSQLRKDLGEVRNLVTYLLRPDDDVVDLCLNDASYQLPEDTSQASLEGSAYILEPEGHCLVIVHAERSDERG